jgi:hypothetical protein
MLVARDNEGKAVANEHARATEEAKAVAESNLATSRMLASESLQQQDSSLDLALLLAAQAYLDLDFRSSPT